MNLWTGLIIDNDNHCERGREGEVYLALPPDFFSLLSLLPALAQADKRGKKERFVVLNKTAHLKMLPELYLNCLESQLSASQLLTLEMLVWLLQFHKQVRIERLAACFPLPILYESRRRHVQRFLALPQLSIPLLWFPLIKRILLTQIQPGTQVIPCRPLKKKSYVCSLPVRPEESKRSTGLYWKLLSLGTHSTSRRVDVLSGS